MKHSEKSKKIQTTSMNLLLSMHPPPPHDPHDPNMLTEHTQMLGQNFIAFSIEKIIFPREK